MSALDINVRVTVEAPALVDAVNRLCDRFSPVQTGVATVPAAPIQEAPQAPTAPAEAPSQQPVAEPSTAAQAPAQAAPAPAPAPAKVIDLDTISRAGAALIDQGKMPQVLGVLKEFGVEAITQLQPSSYPAFAERLKALGAVI